MDEVLNTDDAIFACRSKGNMLDKLNSLRVAHSTTFTYRCEKSVKARVDTSNVKN